MKFHGGRVILRSVVQFKLPCKCLHSREGRVKLKWQRDRVL